jgi:hypothetical protein
MDDGKSQRHSAMRCQQQKRDDGRAQINGAFCIDDSPSKVNPLIMSQKWVHDKTTMTTYVACAFPACLGSNEQIYPVLDDVRNCEVSAYDSNYDDPIIKLGGVGTHVDKKVDVLFCKFFY